MALYIYMYTFILLLTLSLSKLRKFWGKFICIKDNKEQSSTSLHVMYCHANAVVNKNSKVNNNYLY